MEGKIFSSCYHFSFPFFIFPQKSQLRELSKLLNYDSNIQWTLIRNYYAYYLFVV